MRKNNCEVIRRELDELMLDETCSASVTEHLKECSACREFHQTQIKLRRMVGSLGTVAAPADFDFRLRARLANDSSNGAFHFWSFARKGLAVAAVLLVLGTGIVVVRNVVNQQTKHEVVADKVPPVSPQSPKTVETTPSKAPEVAEEFTAQKPAGSPERIKRERSVQTASKSKRSLEAVDFSSQRAEVVSGVESVGSSAIAVFPIDASSQTLKVSLDDGRGNAKTISVPSIRFGSQGMLPNANQYAPKGIW